MKSRITPETEAAYRSLAAVFSELDSAFMAAILAIGDAEIPDAVKCKLLDRLKDKPAFKSIAYFLTPQTEWLGGDSSDPKNFAVMNPHIAR